MADPVVIPGLAYAGKEAVGVVAEFVREVFGPSVRATGKGLAAPLEAWAESRADNAKRVVIDAAAAVEEAGGMPNAVPGRVLLPLLERASVEEDEELRQRWVCLLANASMSPDSIFPAFVMILGELSPHEAKVLKERDLAELVKKLELSEAQASVIVANLKRLSLIKIVKNRGTYEDHWPLPKLRLTPFGRAFIRACRTPAVEESVASA